jgi:hypothetical protein
MIENDTPPIATVYVSKEDGLDYPMRPYEWEEWATANRTPEQYANPAPNHFLSSLRDTYLAGGYLRYEDAVSDTLPKIPLADIESIVAAANQHLRNSNCTECGIINDDAFAENSETGEEGPLVDYELNQENISDFLNKEGSNGLYEHLKIYLPYEEWKVLTKENERRQYEDAKRRGVIR